MIQKPLGSTNLTISCIGLGGMPLSIQGRPDEKQALQVINKAIELGVNFIDTADVYCLDHTDIGHNERLIAKALQNNYNNITVATKGGLIRPNGDWVCKGDAKHLQQACENSLIALNVDCITLYQLHAPDPTIEFNESIEQLAKLQQQGKIKHIGLSNVTVSQIKQAQQLIKVVSVQNRCNIHDTRALEVIDYCANHDISFIAYSPVGGSHGKQAIADDAVIAQIANKYQASNFTIAIAWLLSKGNIVPIPGATKISSINSSVNAASLQLAPEDTSLLDSKFLV